MRWSTPPTGGGRVQAPGQACRIWNVATVDFDGIRRPATCSCVAVVPRALFGGLTVVVRQACRTSDTPELAARLIAHRSHVSQRDNLFITLDDGISRDRLRVAIKSDTPVSELSQVISNVSGTLKLERAPPEDLIDAIMTRRFRDPESVEHVAAAPIDLSEPKP